MVAGTMWRVTTVVTGVAGSPYYMRGYFDATAGTVTQAVNGWHSLVGSTPGGVPSGATITTQAEVDLVDAITGQVLGTAIGGTDKVVVGTNSTQLQPPQTQLLLRWRTGAYVGGREVRGRTSLPMRFASELAAGGNPSAATVTGANTAIATFLAGTGYKHVVWSKKAGEFFPTVNGSTWNQYAVLRSRRD